LSCACARPVPTVIEYTYGEFKLQQDGGATDTTMESRLRYNSNVLLPAGAHVPTTRYQALSILGCPDADSKAEHLCPGKRVTRLDAKTSWLLAFD
jgi:hypothetical protein